MRDQFQVLKVYEGTGTGNIILGVGDYFQVRKVTEGTCIGKILAGGDMYQYQSIPVNIRYCIRIYVLSGTAYAKHIGIKAYKQEEQSQ